MSYYPFVFQLCDGTKDSNVQNHKYNGKELDKMHGLNTYDYGARQYNPVTARWDRIYPLCEKYYSISPYAYCANNPVKYVDPDGRERVISFATNTMNGPQNIKNQRLTKSSQKYPDNPKVLNFFGHGIPKGQGVSLVENGGGRNEKERECRDVDQFYDYLKKEGRLLCENEKKGETTLLAMHSCQTGNGDGSFAEKLSGKHKNPLVIAPTENVGLNNQCESVKKAESGEGQWKVFHKGKTIGTISGKNNTLKEILSSEKPVEKLLITMVLPEVSKLLNK